LSAILGIQKEEYHWQIVDMTEPVRARNARPTRHSAWKVTATQEPRKPSEE
jgi:hypothetical protein